MKKKCLFTNTVYGPIYSKIFLDLHLNSFLDQTNAVAHKDRLEYTIFTDAETEAEITNHPNFKTLCKTVPTKISVFDWPPQHKASQQYDFRYSILTRTFCESVAESLEKNYYCSALTADYVFAQNFFQKVFKKMDEGHGAVQMMPMRAAYESLNGILSLAEGALTSDKLFYLAYHNMHPLWVAAHWSATQFTKLPFTLLWNSGGGLLAHSFATTPVMFQPVEKMKYCKKTIDVEVPSLCKNPYYANDWDEVPCICVEPLFCYYPPFMNKRASSTDVATWARKNLHPHQLTSFQVPIFYPNKKDAGFFTNTRDNAKSIVSEVVAQVRTM